MSGLRIALTPATVSAAGALSGFMGATTAEVTPVLALLYQHHPGPVLRATLGFLYFVSSAVLVAPFHLAGRFGAHEMLLGLELFPGVTAGYLISGYPAPYFDRGYRRAAVLTIPTISALLLIIRNV